jgi:hypothetical protein
MRVSVLLIAALALTFAASCKKEEAKKPKIVLGADEASCRTVCNKGPRQHFEAKLALKLKGMAKEEHEKARKEAETEWALFAKTDKHKGSMQYCISQCVLRTQPGEIDCLVKAKTIHETYACQRKYRKANRRGGPGGTAPKPPTPTKAGAPKAPAPTLEAPKPVK